MSASETDSAKRLGAPPLGLLAIVGTGLIGGSFAAALRRSGAATRIVGVGRRPESLEQACALGLIDAAVSLKEAAATADCIFLSAPVGAFESLLQAMRPWLRDQTLLTDAGSTKVEVIGAARRALGDRIGQFVPGHPVAGAEATGPQAADPDLYRNRHVVLTPLAENLPASVERVRRLWQECGASVLELTPEDHDRVLASISHLPHFLSSAYMAQVAQAADASTRLGLAGSGFRDVTRIAAGSPEMWRDIFLSNKQAVRRELADLRTMLDRFESAMLNDDGETLTELLELGSRARRAWTGK